MSPKQTSSCTCRVVKQPNEALPASGLCSKNSQPCGKKCEPVQSIFDRQRCVQTSRNCTMSCGAAPQGRGTPSFRLYTNTHPCSHKIVRCKQCCGLWVLTFLEHDRTMHHWKDLIKPDPTELSIKSISERGPAKWPSEDEKMTSWRHRKALRCARRGRPKVVQLGQRVLQTVSKCAYKHTEAP